MFKVLGDDVDESRVSGGPAGSRSSSIASQMAASASGVNANSPCLSGNCGSACKCNSSEGNRGCTCGSVECTCGNSGVIDSVIQQKLKKRKRGRTGISAAAGPLESAPLAGGFRVAQLGTTLSFATHTHNRRDFRQICSSRTSRDSGDMEICL